MLAKIKSITAARPRPSGSVTIREGSPGAVLVNDPALTEECADVARKLLGEIRW